MFKKLFALLLVAAMLLSLAACGQDETTPSAEADPSNIADPITPDDEPDIQQPEETPEDDTTDTPEEDPAKEPDETTEPAQTVERVIYYGDSTAEGLLHSTVTVADETPEALVEALQAADVLAADVQLNSFELDTIGDEETIVLDFNAAFLAQVSSLGTAGESVLLGSVVNTFLDAYPKNTQVLLTVEGATMETGHNSYEAPLRWYSTTTTTDLTFSVTLDGVEQLVDATRIYSQLGIAISYATDYFSYQENTEFGLVSFRSFDAAENGSAMAFLSISQSEYDLEATTAGLELQADSAVTYNDAYIGSDSIAATQLTCTSSDGFYLDYFVFQADATVYIVEMGYRDGTVDTLVPLLVAMLNSVSLLS